MIGTDIAYAARLLAGNQPVAIPTETVYGLAANARSEDALRRVFALKDRPLRHPLIVHLADSDALRQFASSVPHTATQLLKAFSPGPLTVLLRSNGSLPPLVNGGRPLLAFRIPAHPLALALLRRLPFPLVAPSANRFTQLSPTEPAHVLQQFGPALPYILDGGACAVGVESTVVGFDEAGDPVLYRPGAIPAEAIEAVTGRACRPAPPGDGSSPGLHRLHYAPRTPLTLLTDQTVFTQPGRVGLLVFQHFHPAIPVAQQVCLSPSGNLEEAARNLYGALHRLDALGLERLYAGLVPDRGIGRAINDRIRRALTIFTPEPSPAPYAH